MKDVLPPEEVLKSDSELELVLFAYDQLTNRVLPNNHKKVSLIQPDESLDINCPGCHAALTTNNAGGYRCYCDKCVQAMPELPASINNDGFYLSGKYPGFEWLPVNNNPLKAT